MILIGFFIGCLFAAPYDVIAAQKPAMIHLNYKIDQKKHKVVFPQEKITLAVGQIIRIKMDDLFFGGDFFEKDVLDIDWEEGDSITCYFKGKNPGTCKIQFIDTGDNSTKGELEITVVGKSGPRGRNELSRVYYNYAQSKGNDGVEEGLEFFPSKIKLKLGQRMLLLPQKRNLNQKSFIIEYSNDDVLDELLPFIGKGKDLFKATAIGNVKMEIHIAHEYFTKGTLEVDVTK